ncbi:hypothetical protein [Herbaspirillum seropedicae]|uniref:hypothetical protein n=2 Tax=Herbaspirillum seropedicae TaxID=964 RepID=UPI0015C58215|nr:hypothetical protein [Herbaspirillum seropedicae]
MRSIKVPRMKFCPWFSWEDRKDIPLSEMPGIYLLSITKKNLAGSLPDWKDVSYIGMTNSRQGLIGRWQQFFNSIRGTPGHSGGNAVFDDLKHYDQWDKKLFVAAMPIECNVVSPSKQDLIKMGWVAYLEYEAFAKCVASNSKPKYNTR